MVVKLHPFFYYFGSKYRIALKYPKPKWITIVEPFAGSAGYSLHYPNRRVLLYDKNEKVCGVWEYLIRTSVEEILKLPIVFNDLRDLDICQEAKWFIGFYISKGSATPRNIPTPWTLSGSRPNTSWGIIALKRISEQLRFIRHWKVYNTGYDNAPDIKATWFVDPPYQRSGKSYTHSDVLYPYLSKWAKERKGQVIACGQKGDDWLDFSPFCTNRTTCGKNPFLTSIEVIWTNDSSGYGSIFE